MERNRKIEGKFVVGLESNARRTIEEELVKSYVVNLIKNIEEDEDTWTEEEELEDGEDNVKTFIIGNLENGERGESPKYRRLGKICKQST